MISRRSSTGAAEDEDILSRPVYLFKAGRWRGVSREPLAASLPQPPQSLSWTYEDCVALGVQRVELPGTEPEPVITGLMAHGYYVWQVSTDEAAAL